MTHKKQLSSSGAKYEQIANSIIDEIMSSKLATGSELPSMRSCAQEFGVSLSTVERAYSLLEDRGFIETTPGKASTVCFLKGDTEAKSTIWKAFLSYAREDDKHSGNAITTLRNRIKEEYALQTGEELDLFQDVEDIACGMNWRQAIEENLGATLFFIPILTPTYLRRPHCLQELREARRRFNDLGMVRGIYPIHFVDIGKAIEKIEDDDLASFISDTQANCDWRDLRICDPYSPEYCKGIQSIVQALIERDEEMAPLQLQLANPKDSPLVLREAELDEGDPIREIVELEEKFEKIIDITNEISKTIVRVGEVVSNEEITEAAPFSEKLRIIKKIGQNLEEPAEALSKQSSIYRDQLLAIDKGIDSIGYFVELSNSLNQDTSDLGLEDLHTKLYLLNTSTQETFEEIAGFKSMLNMMAGLSRDLRAPCRKIEAGVDELLASQAFFQQWENRVASWRDASGE